MTTYAKLLPAPRPSSPQFDIQVVSITGHKQERPQLRCFLECFKNKTAKTPKKHASREACLPRACEAMLAKPCVPRPRPPFLFLIHSLSRTRALSLWQ